MSTKRRLDKRKNRADHKKGKSTDTIKNKITMKELLMMQSIACSVLLLGGLLLNLNNPTFINDFGTNFREIVSNDSFLPSSEHFSNVRSYIIGVFGNEPENGHADFQEDYDAGFRIDEDILNEINLRNEMRNPTGDEKKYPAP